MKVFFPLIFITVMGLTTVNSQKLSLGIKGGFNFTEISGDTPGDVGFQTSYHFGVVAELPFSDQISFQPELLYSAQGFTLDDTLTDLDYLNVPLLLKYYVVKGFSIEAGPQIGMLLSAEKEDVDVKEFFNTLDLGLNLGIGYKLNNGLHFSARYMMGFSDINDSDTIDTKSRNSMVQFSIGYFFF